MPGEVAHTFDPSTRDVEVGDLYVFKASLIYIESPDQPRLHSEAASQKEKDRKNGR